MCVTIEYTFSRLHQTWNHAELRRRIGKRNKKIENCCDAPAANSSKIEICLTVLTFHQSINQIMKHSFILAQEIILKYICVRDTRSKLNQMKISKFFHFCTFPLLLLFSFAISRLFGFGFTDMLQTIVNYCIFCAL